jgi:hypothetical protein
MIFSRIISNHKLFALFSSWYLNISIVFTILENKNEKSDLRYGVLSKD